MLLDRDQSRHTFCRLLRSPCSGPKLSRSSMLKVVFRQALRAALTADTADCPAPAGPLQEAQLISHTMDEIALLCQVWVNAEIPGGIHMYKHSQATYTDSCQTYVHREQATHKPCSDTDSACLTTMTGSAKQAALSCLQPVPASSLKKQPMVRHQMNRCCIVQTGCRRRGALLCSL